MKKRIDDRKKSDGRPKVLQLNAYRTMKADRAENNNTKGNLRRFLVLGLTLTIFAFGFLWTTSPTVIVANPLKWHVLTVIIVAVAILYFLKGRRKKKAEKSSTSCIRCHKPIDGQSGMCHNCGGKATRPFD